MGRPRARFPPTWPNNAQTADLTDHAGPRAPPRIAKGCTPEIPARGCRGAPRLFAPWRLCVRAFHVLSSSDPTTVPANTKTQCHAKPPGAPRAPRFHLGRRFAATGYLAPVEQRPRAVDVGHWRWRIVSID